MIAVAIDGPAGAGKSTIAKMAAEKLGYIYMDTGALYRAVGHACLQQNINVSNAPQVDACVSTLTVDLRFVDGVQRVFVNGEDVTDYIRTEKISKAASRVSAFPEVRSFLLDLQRDFATSHNVIMDGRDIGTVVLPNAQVKVFLTASPEERARRRVRQYEEQGTPADYEEILSEIKQRDYNDSTRAAAPLKPAEDAVLLDTTGLTLEESFQQLLSIIQNRVE